MNIALDRKSTRLNSSHRELHSFPTRRSSDLTHALAVGELGIAEPVEATIALAVGHVNREANEHCVRSEEHTSELQSPRATLFPYTTLFRSYPRPCRRRAWHC